MAARSLTYRWTAIYLMIVLMVLLTNIVESMAGKVNLSGHRLQEIELKLKQLNKQAVKSIEETLNGEIIDCISITKQPAFDNPMLKNHTIQMIPSSYPLEGNASARNDDKEQEDIDQLWQLVGECPENTIPIRRVTKEDLSRIDYIENYGKKVSRYSNISRPHQIHHRTAIPNQNNNHEYAITYVDNGVFRGAKAYINIWKPRVQEAEEFSLSQIRVKGGQFGLGLNSVEAGWNVCPRLYGGDTNPRIFIYWTRDDYKDTGCYNLFCPGFVQVNKRIALGALLKDSTYNGQQYKLTVLIWKDPKTGNWWLHLNDKELIGYWPSELLPNLANAANQIEWGGEVVNLKQGGQHTTTEMGSGHFPSGRYKKSSYFRAIKVIDMTNNIINPTKVQSLVSRPNCYNLITGSSYSKPWEVFFFYGGPGRNPKCL